MRIMIGIDIFLITFSLPAWAQESFDNMYFIDYHSAPVKINLQLVGPKTFWSKHNFIGQVFDSIQYGAIQGPF